MKKIIVKKGREKSLKNKHPWIFSGALEGVKGKPESGETVEVVSFNNEFLGIGFFSPHSQIRSRIWSFDNEIIDEGFFRRKIETAINYRQKFCNLENVNAYRLINSEADGLPGLTVDKYGDYLVCQFLSVGVDYWKDTFVALLMEIINPVGIYERSDSDVRQKEGLKYSKGILAGNAPDEFIEIEENSVKYLVDIRNGHKTGFYLDQRENRKILSDYSKDKVVLNCFSYTGGFGVTAALAGAASIRNLDSSNDVLKMCKENFSLNGITADKYENHPADVFKELRSYRLTKEKFDIIILDPPKFVEGKASLVKAARGYKDINMLAFELLKDDGLLFTFSCSGLMQPDLFQKIVSDAALDAGTEGSIIRRLWQAPDHRVILNFPESLYLKGLVVKKGG